MKITTRTLLLLLLLAIVIWPAAPAAAQNEGALVIGTLEPGSFPTIRFQFDAYDSQGRFINDLQAADLTIQEDNQSLKPAGLQKIQNGLQVILVLNTAPSMTTKIEGATQYQRIQEGLLTWARAQSGRRSDDFSLSTPTGLFLIRERDPKLLLKAITDYQPDLLHTQPSLGSLAEALDLATDPLQQPMMKRAILFITPTLPDNQSVTLKDLASRAKSIGVRVNVWEVTAIEKAPGAAPDPLQQLAETTSGGYQAINLKAPLPDPEPLFAPLRSTYQVSYQSALISSGMHTLRVQARRLASNTSSFDLTVSPPNPIFLSPPASVQRNWTSPGKGQPAALSPESVALQIVIEFPDKHQRPIKATRLYVNGELAAENTSEPFDRFTWLVGTLTAPSRQTLRAEAVDMLGMTGSSMEVPVEVVIEQQARTSIVSSISSRGMIAVGAMLAAGTVLTLVLVFTSSQRRSRRRQVDKKLMNDPVTQPVTISQDHSRPAKRQSPVAKPAPSRPVSWPAPPPVRPNGQSVPARLIALDENEEPVTGGAIPLARQEITFGTDPKRATQILDSQTVDGLHARLYRDTDGCFFLLDRGSVAGTWVNYSPITEEGIRLQHGDMVHIGKVVFRFELTDPDPAAEGKITVTELDTPL